MRSNCWASREVSEKPQAVIVTRPGHAGRRLAERIMAHTQRVLWWPAFEIDAAPDPDAARAKLAQLSDYDLALFVSAHAVRATASLLSAPWPRTTMMGADGAATRLAVEVELQPALDVVRVAPNDEDESGSEAFWSTWQAHGYRARRVLLLRATDGREWLAERLASSGAEVDALAVYSRRPHCPSNDDVSQLRQWIAAGIAPATVFSSSEAATALDHQVDASARRWLRSGTAIATHVRIAMRLADDGYARVISATFDDDSIIAKLESIRGSA